jgi:uncharacterized protein (DUF1330 family)
MPAYVIAEIDVHNPADYEEYKKMVPSTITAYGGRYIARGGKTETLEGNWSPKRIAILEFESMERAKEWLHSELYGPAKKIRHASAKTNMIVIEGI